jgi:hypothetical protein
MPHSDAGLQGRQKLRHQLNRYSLMILRRVDHLKLVEACNVTGGPAPVEVKRALCEREKQILLTKSNISKMDKELEDAENKLETTVQQFTAKPRGNGTFKNYT